MKPEGMFMLPLTVSQRMALIQILCEYIEMPGRTLEIIDCARNQAIRPGDFLRLLDSAIYFPDLPAAKLINSLAIDSENAES